MCCVEQGLTLKTSHFKGEGNMMIHYQEIIPTVQRTSDVSGV